MFHDPRSDRHIGRHARTSKPPTATPRRPLPLDAFGRRVPPPPAHTAGPGPLVRAVASERELAAVCWEALCATNPIGLTDLPERREARYRPVALRAAGRLHRSLRRNTAAVRDELSAALAAEFDREPLRGRLRRAVRWVDTEWVRGAPR